MARLARVESFAGDEVAVVHVMNRVVRRCFLLGDDAVTGKNFDHRKFEEFISRQQVRGTRLPQRITVGVCISAGNRQHVQQVVIRRGSSPTVQRKNEDSWAAEPLECELNSIRFACLSLRQTRLWTAAKHRSRNNCRLVKVAITLRGMISNKHWTVISRTVLNPPSSRNATQERAGVARTCRRAVLFCEHVAVRPRCISFPVPLDVTGR